MRVEYLLYSLCAKYIFSTLYIWILFKFRFTGVWYWEANNQMLLRMVVGITKTSRIHRQVSICQPLAQDLPFPGTIHYVIRDGSQILMQSRLPVVGRAGSQVDKCEFIASITVCGNGRIKSDACSEITQWHHFIFIPHRSAINIRRATTCHTGIWSMFRQPCCCPYFRMTWLIYTC